MSSPLLLLLFATTAAAPSGAARDARFCQASRSLFERLEAFHQGEGPCLRYDNPCHPALSDDERVRLARALRAEGIDAAAWGQSLGQLFVWAEEVEALHHTKSEAEEQLDAMLAEAPPDQREALRPSLETRAARSATPPAVRQKGQATFAALPAAQRRKIRAAWEKDAKALTHSFIEVLEALQEIENEHLLSTFVSEIQAAHKKTGSFPAAHTVKIPRDARGQPLRYRHVDGGVVVGVADAPPREQRFVSAAGVRAYQDVVEERGCALTDGARITLSRDLGLRLRKDPQAALQKARIVPAFVDGKNTGFKVFAIEEGSYFHAICLRDGDVLTHLGETRLRTPVQLQQFLFATSGAHRLRVERGGRSYAITVQPPP